MQVENSFSVEAPIESVWSYLLDVRAVAPCIPGAELTEVVSDSEYRGSVTVKLGAVKVSYKGTVVLTEIDHENHRVVLTAKGSETRGAGAASGTVTSTVTAESARRTRVDLVSEIQISGRVAQFGRNIVQDVSNRLIQDFARCLESNLSQPHVESDAEPSTGDEHSDQTQTTATPDAQAAAHSGSQVPPEQSSFKPARSAAPSEVKLLPIVVD